MTFYELDSINLKFCEIEKLFNYYFNNEPKYKKLTLYLVLSLFYFPKMCSYLALKILIYIFIITLNKIIN